MHEPFSNVVLGTAGLGSDYGMGDITAPPNDDELSGIFSEFTAGGGKRIDTAPSYRNAESRIGQFDLSNFLITTKVKVGTAQLPPDKALVQSVLASLKHLGLQSLDGLLIHDSEKLSVATFRDVGKVAAELKHSGLIRRFGVSVYSPKVVFSILDQIDLDFVQIPFNVLDRRFVTSGLAAVLRKRGVTVDVRSIFLQGVLLDRSIASNPYFKRWDYVFHKWYSCLDSNAANAVEGCVRFCETNAPGCDMVVGVNRLAYLRELRSVMQHRRTLDYSLVDQFGELDQELLEPFRWKASKVDQGSPEV